MTTGKSRVFYLTWDRRERLPELLEKAGVADIIKAGELVALKMHFGEKEGTGCVKPEFLRHVIRMVRAKKASPFLADTGTIYRGKRSNAVDHITLAAAHGFSENRLQVPIIIADGLKGGDFEEVEIGGKNFAKVKIATAIKQADAMISLAHFKGHLLSGWGGAIKNLGMGCGSRLGKFEMHSSVAPEVALDSCTGCGACIENCAHGALSLVDGKIALNTDICAGCGECVVACDFDALSIAWEKGGAEVQERFAEYALGAVKDKRIFCLNFLNHITPNCDCMSKGETPLLPDLGIVASADPVAVDQASYDLIKGQAGDVFAKVFPQIDSTVQLVHGEKMGLGKRSYVLTEI